MNMSKTKKANIYVSRPNIYDRRSIYTNPHAQGIKMNMFEKIGKNIRERFIASNTYDDKKHYTFSHFSDYIRPSIYDGNGIWETNDGEYAWICELAPRIRMTFPLKQEVIIFSFSCRKIISISYFHKYGQSFKANLKNRRKGVYFFIRK